MTTSQRMGWAEHIALIGEKYVPSLDKKFRRKETRRKNWIKGFGTEME
jgi:hypothetical protein